MDIQVHSRAADNIRILSAAMVEKAKSGHPGGAMGGADFVEMLFSEFLSFDPDDGAWPLRDRFFLDPGHMSPMLYSILAMTGRYTLEELKNFRQWGSPTPGHPELDVERGVENTSGPLGRQPLLNVSWLPALVSGFHTRPMPLSPTGAYRRRSHRVPGASPVSWASPI